MNALEHFESWLAKERPGLRNPWANLTAGTFPYNLYNDEPIFKSELDKNYQFKTYTSSQFSEFEYIANIPPEPWGGNPLTAKLIILTLNPGFIEKQNKDLAIKIQNDKQIIDPILKFKKDTLLLKAESFLPPENAEDKNLTTADYLNIIGDWYWQKRFQPLMEVLKISNHDDLYKKVAIIQYIAYQSKSYKDGTTFPSQEYTRYLIKYILTKRKNVTVLVLRSASKWRNEINALLNVDIQKNDVIFNHNNNSILFNYNRSQALSSKNLKENFKIICDALK